MRALGELAASIVASAPDVSAVVLFGSLARGDHGPRSDADVLVCLRGDRADRPADRIPRFLAALLDAPIPVEVLPFTEAELRRRLEGGSWFWRRALGEGIVLAGEVPATLLVLLA